MVAGVSKGEVAIGAETLDDFLDRWLEHLESIGRSPVYVRECRYKKDTLIKPDLGGLRLSRLTTRHIDALYSKLTKRGLKPRTVRTVHAILSSSLHQAEKWGVVDHSVARQATPPAVHAEQAAVPNPAEVRRILDVAEEVEPALAVLLLVAALTGARRGELCALRWSDLDLEARVLTIGRSVYETAGGGWAEKATKTHQARRVGLDSLGVTVLRKYRKDADKIATKLGLTIPADAFLFSRSPIGSEPYRPDHVSKFTARIAKAAGVETHLHALRHFSATQAIGAGFDARTVASRLGHADPSITLRVYSHAIEQRDQELATALGRTLAPPRISGKR